MKDCKINVLGTEYQILFKNLEDDKKLEDSNGYIDETIKTIVICNKSERDEIQDFDRFQRKVLRHEVIHAFHIESGLHESLYLNDAGFPELIVDWFAIQSPKIYEVFAILGILD